MSNVRRGFSHSLDRWNEFRHTTDVHCFEQTARYVDRKVGNAGVLHTEPWHVDALLLT